ncbi:pyroglutamyl-peptidase I [Bifidobacterium sp.]|jgi:pyroglutamyl-peptidase|uniref:pyroglutamyl-peptidase I n=1 Tax=Bifidobacterium sp. TaxID=41200 RepID=UPI0025C1D7AF|nr:pyroglutamyl-peptidase I [Bifidobacterium sp.]MCH4210020.1 pyroglutamyl-peptidase I [Bifidobacterium sp.]MCI1225416.1 pyroglutamyl-peptidase I [Bifidobacterium sp.]
MTGRYRITSKLLLSGFEPFLGNGINPTEAIVSALDGDQIGGVDGITITGAILPVDFQHGFERLLEAYQCVQPDIVLMLGLAAGRPGISAERIAVNCDDSAPDNAGCAPHGSPIDPTGADGYFSTLPIERMVQALKDHGYPAFISNSAGTYLCNHVMYAMLNHIRKTRVQVPAGFVHVPASHELAVSAASSSSPGAPLPSWAQSDLNAAIKIVIGVLGEKLA